MKRTEADIRLEIARCEEKMTKVKRQYIIAAFAARIEALRWVLGEETFPRDEV